MYYYLSFILCGIIAYVLTGVMENRNINGYYRVISFVAFVRIFFLTINDLILKGYIENDIYATTLKVIFFIVFFFYGFYCLYTEMEKIEKEKLLKKQEEEKIKD